MLSEIDQRKTNTIWSHLYMNLKKEKKSELKKKQTTHEVKFIEQIGRYMGLGKSVGANFQL